MEPIGCDRSGYRHPDATMASNTPTMPTPAPRSRAVAAKRAAGSSSPAPRRAISTNRSGAPSGRGSGTMQSRTNQTTSARPAMRGARGRSAIETAADIVSATAPLETWRPTIGLRETSHQRRYGTEEGIPGRTGSGCRSSMRGPSDGGRFRAFAAVFAGRQGCRSSPVQVRTVRWRVRRRVRRRRGGPTPVNAVAVSLWVLGGTRPRSPRLISRLELVDAAGEMWMKGERAVSVARARRQGGENLVATRFMVRVPPSRRVTLAVPSESEPGEAEVIVLHRPARPAPRQAPGSRSRRHPAFGLWASRPEAADPVAFVDGLRRRMTERGAPVRKAR